MDSFLFFKFLNVLLSSFLLIGSWLAKRVIGVWLNPVSILLIIWFFYIFAPLLIAFEAPVNPFSVLYIVFFCYAFFFSLFFFKCREAFLRNRNKPPAEYYFDKSIIRTFFYFFSVFAVVMTVLGMFRQGISLKLMLSNPLAVGGEYAGRRYAGDLVSSIYSQLGLQACYYTAVFGGLIYGVQNRLKRKGHLLFFAFFPALLIMLTQSAKGLFFFSIFLFFGGLLVTRVYKQNFTLMSFADFRSVCKYAVLAFPVVIASFLSRGLYQSSHDISFILNRLRSYLISYSSVHLPAFSDWFSGRYFNDSLVYYKQETLTWGFYTFMSIFRLLGDDRYVPMGTYDEFYEYGDFIKGNLYTVFRGLITDFSLPGSLFVGFLLGLLCNFAYWLLLGRRSSAFSVVFFIYFLAICYQTYAISSFIWITIPFVFCLQWLMLHFLMKIKVAE